MPLALGGDHTMTYPILHAIKVHVSTNNTDMMYTLCLRGRPHYDLSYTQAIKVHACANNTDRMYTLCFRGDHTMTYPILQAIKVHVSTNNTDMMYTLSFRWRPHYDFLIAWSWSIG
jgi:arginase family enzyme